MPHTALIEGAMTLREANEADQKLVQRYLEGELLTHVEQQRVDLFTRGGYEQVQEQIPDFRAQSKLWKLTQQG